MLSDTTDAVAAKNVTSEVFTARYDNTAAANTVASMCSHSHCAVSMIEHVRRATLLCRNSLVLLRSAPWKASNDAQRAEGESRGRGGIQTVSNHMTTETEIGLVRLLADNDRRLDGWAGLCQRTGQNHATQPALPARCSGWRGCATDRGQGPGEKRLWNLDQVDTTTRDGAGCLGGWARLAGGQRRTTQDNVCIGTGTYMTVPDK